MEIKYLFKILFKQECFTANTLASTKNGFKAIKEIKAGDKLKLYSGKTIVVTKVSA